MMLEPTYVHLFLLLFILNTLMFAEELDLNTLSYYEVIEPLHVGVDGHHRDRRDLSTYDDVMNTHVTDTSYTFEGHGRVFHLHVYRNNILVPDKINFITQDALGAYVFSKNKNNNAGRCHYHGYLSNRMSSYAVVTTCGGLDGLIKDEDGEEFVIAPHPNDQLNRDGMKVPRKHILYNNRDVIRSNEKYTCGVREESDTRYNIYGNASNNRNSSYYGNIRDDGYQFKDVIGGSMLKVITPNEHHR